MIPLLLVSNLATVSLLAQASDPGTVLGRIRLDDLREPFERTLGERDEFAESMASLGDINGDGTIELAIGAPGDFAHRGALWIFSLTNDRHIDRYVKLGPVERLPFELAEDDRFGTSVTALSDLDGDGVRELAVGAPGNDDGLLPPFSNGGAIYLLFLRRDGTIRQHLKFSNSVGLPLTLAPGDSFGTAIEFLGDLAGDGTPELAVGTPGDDEGGIEAGAVYVLSLAPDQSVTHVQKIGALAGGLTGLTSNSRFGTALALLGDLSGDGAPELAVGAPRARVNHGNVFLLGLETNATVRTQSALLGGPAGGYYGSALAALGDLDGNGVPDLAVGPGSGQVQIARLNSSGTLAGSTFLDSGVRGLTAPGDRNGDGRPDLFMGLTGVDRIGGFVIHDLTPTGTSFQRTTFGASNLGGIAIAPRPGDGYGSGIAPIGDLDGNGLAEVVVSAPGDGHGALWIHYLTPTSGTRVLKVPAPPGLHAFGLSLARLGDLDRDGHPDLACLTDQQLSVLFLTAIGKIREHRETPRSEIGATQLTEIEPLGDLDGDGNSDLLLRSGQNQVFFLYLAGDGSVRSTRLLNLQSLGGDRTRLLDAAFLGREPNSGALRVALTVSNRVYRLRLAPDGTVLATDSRVVPTRANHDGVGLGDLDGDGWSDFGDLDTGGRRLYLDFLAADGTLRAQRFFSTGKALGVRPLGDLSGDGVADLAASVRGSSAGLSHVVLFQLGGTATGGFEHQDNAEETPLENGRVIPRPHPGRTFQISSSGANLGAAIFDSNPTGPNQGNDLTVGSGNVLILQDSLAPTQSTPLVFDEPSDDPDGGVLAFEFPRPVQALSIELADLDPFPNRGAQVWLYDDAGASRIYDVPAGWTGPFGSSALRRLDLATLAPQLGNNGNQATASEAPGFAAQRVVRVEVVLFNGGAVDDLTWDPYP